MSCSLRGLAILAAVTLAASGLQADPGWAPSFDDEFNGTSLNTNTWLTHYRNQSTINNELEWYADSAVTVSGGYLHLTATKLTTPIVNSYGTFYYTSGAITSKSPSGGNGFAQLYGRFDISCKVPAGNGFWPAFWMLRDSGGWPPEIDVQEILSQDPTTANTTLHWTSNGKAVGEGGSYTGPNFSTGFHTFSAVWDPTKVIWYIDGVERYRLTHDIPYQSMYLLANMAIGGSWPVPPDATTPFPSEMTIDYIRAYSTSGAQRTWNAAAGGNWSNTASSGWNATAPLLVDDQATVEQTLTAHATLSLNVPVTLGGLILNDKSNLYGWTLASTNSATNTLTFSSQSNTAYLASRGGGQIISAPIILNTDVTASVTTAGSLKLTGSITGAGGLIKGEFGTLTLTGSATYAGRTGVNQGTFIIASSATVNTGGPLSIGDGATGGQLVLGDTSGPVSATFGGLASGGTSTTANNASTIIAGGSATVSTLTLNTASSTNTTYAGIIGGTGTNQNKIALIMSGAGSLTLSNTNTFTGGLTIKGGTLIAATTVAALGASPGAITLGGTSGTQAAALLLSTNAMALATPIALATNPTAGSLAIGGTGTGWVGVSFTGGVTGTNNLALYNGISSGGLSFTTAALNPVGSITNTGPGLATTTVSAPIGSNVTGVFENSTSSPLSVTGAITVNAAGTTLGNLSGTQLLSVSGGITGSGNLTLRNDSATDGGVTVSGSTVNMTGSVTNVGAGSGSVVVSAVLGPNVNAVTQNSATSELQLTTANTFVGPVNLLAGELIVVSGTALGATTNTLTIAGGTTVDISNAALTLSNSYPETWNGDFTYGGFGSMATGSGAVTLTGSRQVTVAANTLQIGGVIGDSGNTYGITKAGSGFLVLTANNTYSGPTRINAGTLSISADANLGNAPATATPNQLVINNATLGVTGNTAFTLNANRGVGLGPATGTTGGTGTFDIANKQTLTYNGIIASAGNSGTNNLVKTSAGTLVLGGTNTYNGTTTISAGTLQATPGTGLPNGNVILDGGILSNNGTIATFSRALGIAAGQVRFTANGGGFAATGAAFTVNLGGSGSTLAFGAPNFIASGSPLTFGGPNANNILTFQNPLDLAGTAQTIAVNGTASGNVATLAGTISDGSLIKTGSGILRLAAADTYAGGTTVSNGTLQVYGATGNLKSLSALTLNAIAGASTFAYDNTSASGSTAMSLGSLTFAAGDDTVQTSRVASQNVTLSFSSMAARAAGTAISFNVNGGTPGTTNTLAITGQSSGIMGPAYFFANGTTASSVDFAYYTGSYVRGITWGSDTGTTTIAGGGSIASAAYAQTTAAITAQASATFTGLNIVNTANAAQAFTLASSATLTTNAILRSGNGGALSVTTISGGTAIQGANNAELIIRTDMSSDLLTLSTPITANGSNNLIKSGAGTLTLNPISANTYTGTTYLNAGTLSLTGTVAPMIPGDLVINGGTLTHPDSATVNDAIATTANLTINGGIFYLPYHNQTLASFTQNGGTVDTAGYGATPVVTIHKADNTGRTTINGGTFTFGFNQPHVWTTDAMTIAGGALAITARSNNGTQAMTVGTGGLQINQPAAVPFTALTFYNASPTSYGIALSLALNGNLTYSPAAGNPYATSITTGTLTNASEATIALGSGPITFTIGHTASTDADLSIQPCIAGGSASGGLIKAGPGTLLLSGGNTYTGATSISSGTLQAADGVGIPTASRVVLDGGVWLVSGGNVTRAMGTANGYLAWSANGGGFAAINNPVTVSLGGLLTPTVLTWSNLGGTGSTLKFGSATANNQVTFANAIDLAGGARTIQVTAGAGGDSALISGVISDSVSGASLTKTGTGTLVLTGANTYAGGTTVNAGVVAVGAGNNLGASTGGINISNGGTLEATGSLILSATRSISLAAGSTIQIDSGNLTLAAPSAGSALISGSLTTTGAGNLVFGPGTAANSGINNLLETLTSLSVSGTGKVDLQNHDVLLTAPAGGESASLSALRGKVITNSTVASSAVALVSGTEYLALRKPGNLFDGATVTSGEVLGKYTYGGDANLDGVITADDYLALDMGYLFGLSGWTHGCFTGSESAPTAADYAILDNSFHNQSGSLADAEIALHTSWFGQDYLNALNSPVPEPASLSLLALGVTALLPRRRR